MFNEKSEEAILYYDLSSLQFEGFVADRGYYGDWPFVGLEDDVSYRLPPDCLTVTDADVIYLLVSHCVTRAERRYGPGRRPGMKQIEKEGYAWSRMGIDTQLAAAEYLKKYAQRQGMLPAFMRVLQLGDRLPTASEEKYLTAWQEWGFAPEAVALAHDKTVFKCGAFKWGYCNGILRRWDEQGWHSAEAIRRGDEKKAEPKSGGKSDLDKYMKW